MGTALAPAAGACLGAALTLPVDDAAGRCSGGGPALCELQHLYVPAAMTIALAALGVVVLLHVVAGIPPAVRGMRLRRAEAAAAPGEDPAPVALELPAPAASALLEQGDERSERVAAVALALDLGRFLAIEAPEPARAPGD